MLCDVAPLKSLARVAPRTADAAFEGTRHARSCASSLETASRAMDALEILLASRAAPFGVAYGSLIDADSHMRVLEQKARVYADLCATVDVINVALKSAAAHLDRMGDASTRVMRDLRGLGDGADACRNVVRELVDGYIAFTGRYSALRERLLDALPNELAGCITAVAR